MSGIFNSLAADAVGTNLVGSSKGAAGGDPFTGVGAAGTITQVADTTMLPQYGRAAEFVANSTNGGNYAGFTQTFAGPNFRFHGYLRVPTMVGPNTTSESGIVALLAGGTRLVSLNVVGTGAIRVRDGSSSAGTNVKTTTELLTTGGVYEVAGWGLRDASAGTLHVRIRDMTGTVVLTFDLTGINTGASNPDGWRVGSKTSSATSTSTMRWQAFRGDDSATQDYLGPETATNQPPVANAGVDQTVESGAAVTLTGTDSDADGTIAARSWKLGSTEVGTSATLTFIAPVVATDTVRTYTYTATDDKGAATSDTVDVTIRRAVIFDGTGNPYVIRTTT